MYMQINKCSWQMDLGLLNVLDLCGSSRAPKRRR